MKSIHLRAAFLATLAAAASCAGCIPCDHPLSDEKTSVLDERLIGTWKMVDSEKPDDPADVFTIARSKKSGRVLVALMSDKDDAGRPVGKVDEADIYCTTIGKLLVLSIKNLRDDAPADYDIIMYRVLDPNRIEIHTLEMTYLEPALKNKELPGSPPKLTLFGDTTKNSLGRITASTEQLRAFIAKHGEKCFDMTPKPALMVRVPAKQ